MNILISGKLGDFIHTLYVAKYYSYENEINLYYSSEFLEGLDFVGSFNNLKPLVDRQKYIKTFDFYNDQIIDINLTDFRYNKNINNLGWTDLLIDTHRIKKLDTLSWLETDINEDFKNNVIIHRSLKYSDTSFPWKRIIDKYNNDIIFVSTDEYEYNSFIYNKNIKFLKVNNIYDLSVIINSCKLFVGNQSMPFAIASSLNKNRILEINKFEYDILTKHMWYIGESKYYDNLNYYYNDELVKIILFD
jgi:hypothetical protein